MPARGTTPAGLTDSPPDHGAQPGTERFESEGKPHRRWPCPCDRELESRRVYHSELMRAG